VHLCTTVAWCIFIVNWMEFCMIHKYMDVSFSQRHGYVHRLQLMAAMHKGCFWRICEIHFSQYLAGVGFLKV
jgi:hypothetical protein